MDDDLGPHSIQENSDFLRLLQVTDMKGNVRDTSGGGTMQGTSCSKITSPLQEIGS
jgi:hypothetical protein